MSNKILVLVSRKSSVNKKLARYLNKNSKNKFKVELHTFAEIFFEIKTGNVKIYLRDAIKKRNSDIAKYKLVFIRRAGKYVRSIGAIIKYLDLQKPIFAKTTNYGHFGKDCLPWEKIIKM